MGVAAGSPVSAGNTNSHLLDSDADDATTGRLGLNNALAESGFFVLNAQREHNAHCSFIGVAINAVKTILPLWSNNQVGSGADNLFIRTNAITGKFSGTSLVGHGHTGVDGDGALIIAAYIDSVVLHGYFVQGVTQIGVTGTSTDVTTDMGAAIPSTSQTIKGVVVNAPYNRIILRQTNGDKFDDGSGNEVYGRLTESSGTWTLSYYSLISNVETVYSFTIATDVVWYFQQLYSPIVDAPVYSELAVTPSENTTADVVDATELIAGKVLLANTIPPAIASVGVKGVGTRVAKEDHTHEGVHSLGISTDATKLLGDIDLLAGSNVSLTRIGQQLQIAAILDAAGYQEVPSGVVDGVNDTFGPLSFAPASEDSILVFVDSLVVDTANWSLSGSNIVLVTPPSIGQTIYVFYIIASPPTIAGALKTDSITLTSGQVSSKIVVLTATPSSPTDVLVDVITGGPQFFGVDYTIVGNEFRWNGYALDGLLAVGDQVRIHYQL